MNLWAANHDKNVWKYPEVFDTRNFLKTVKENDTETDRVMLDHEAVENLMSFGVGKRRCLGEKLALSLIYLILADILKSFSLHPIKRDGRISEEQLIRLDVVPNDFAAYLRKEKK